MRRAQPSAQAARSVRAGGHDLPCLAAGVPLRARLHPVAVGPSDRGAAWLRRRGVRDVRLCRIGYAAPLTTVPSRPHDLDVLFYGTRNSRREAVVRSLRAAGLVTHAAYDDVYPAWGRELDALAARAKVVVNVHHYPNASLEVVRLAYLLANARAVVSERSDDPDLEGPLSGGQVLCAYDDIVDACRDLVGDAGRRRTLGETGFERLRALDQAAFVREALGW